MIDWLDPFKELSLTHRREVAIQRRQAAEARKRFERVQGAYRQLIDDPRYSEIRSELEASLGETLQQLILESAKCGRCAPYALRVQALNDIVARPLHQLFLEAQRSRMESVESEIPDAV